MHIISDETMAAIAEMDDPIAIIEAAWRDIEPKWDEMETVNPTEYAIPEEQWKAVCQRLIDLDDPSAINRVNYGLTWVNVGPSAKAHTPMTELLGQ